ncbi:MAG: DeoD-type purine-nucleoside phosphorylase [Frankiaceae bacterium]|jgi:purine-nucleoside phosphorylase|nr:DeoD-type purine-nucleoside phosphorylase [Frankiaceae bacterium]
MPTPHISAELGEIAPLVLLPGDPRRARLIAADVLDGARLVTEVRGIEGYTGTCNGFPMTVLASGMGMPSATIYATELVREYGAKRIVRVGTTGGMADHVGLGDVVVASAAHTDSSMTASRIPGVNFSHAPSYRLLRAAVDAAPPGATVHVGAVFTTDHFYLARPALTQALIAHGTLAVEMEAAALYAVAAAEGAEALTLATVSDHLFKQEAMTADERERCYEAMLAMAVAALLAA